MRIALVVLAACHAGNAQRPIAHESPPTQSPGRCVKGRFDARFAPSSQLGFVDDRVHGDLDRNLIRRAIGEHTREFQACYSRYLQRGTLAGRVNAQFTIMRDGSVGDAWVTGFDDELANCVCDVVATLQFLPTHGGAIRVTYPFSFTQDP
jgi:hypothetical protein